jgi:hypothetical protein
MATEAREFPWKGRRAKVFSREKSRMTQSYEEFLAAFRAACELDSTLSLDDIKECWANAEMTAHDLAKASDKMVRTEVLGNNRERGKK